LAQFLSAGVASFGDSLLWGAHSAVGGALSLPLLALLGAAIAIP
jgi:hypothetical protein